MGDLAGAIGAALSIMVGGTPEDFAAAKPVLDVVGKTIVHVGPAGSGQTVKAANQLIVAGNIQLLAEAIVFLEAYGVDTAAAVEVLGGGLAGSAVLAQKAQKMLDREFEPGFRIDLHHKDLGIVTAAAGNGKPQLRVHPDDYPRVEQQLGVTLSLHGWRLLADGELHPGGCKVSAEEGDLDASLATRWHELCRLAAPGEV